MLDPIGNKTVDEGTALAFTASAMDLDAGQTLTFHVSNSNNGLFSVQPAVSHSVAIVAVRVPLLPEE